MSIGHTHRVNQRIAAGLVSVWFGAVMLAVAMAGPPAQAFEPDHPLTETAHMDEAATQMPPHTPPRIVVYGDSLVSEAGQDFAFLAARSGASVQVHTFPGTSPCDYFGSMAQVARDWQPTVAVLLFSGDVFTACNGGVQVGTAQYYAKYRDEIRTADRALPLRRRQRRPDRSAGRQQRQAHEERVRPQSALPVGRRGDHGRALRRRRAGRHGEGAVHLDPALPLGPAVHRTARDERRPLPGWRAFLPRRPDHAGPGPRSV